MKKTLIEWFTTTIQNGELTLKQRASDIFIINDVLYNMWEDVTEEEYKVLYEAIQILRKYDK